MTNNSLIKKKITKIEKIINLLFFKPKENSFDTPSKMIHSTLKHINDIIIEKREL